MDHKESWVLKNWCFWTVVLEKTLESPLDRKVIKSINPKENQPWIFIGRTDVEAETPILWPPDAWNWLIRKDPDAGKDWRQEKGMTEDEMIGWHHRLNGHEFEQAPGVGERQGSVACAVYGVENWATKLNWTHTGWLVKQEKQILISWRAGVLKSKIKSLANLVSGEGSLLFHSLLCLAVSLHGTKGKGTLWGLYQSVNSMRKDFTHMTCSPPKSYLIIPFQREIGLQNGFSFRPQKVVSIHSPQPET